MLNYYIVLILRGALSVMIRINCVFDISVQQLYLVATNAPVFFEFWMKNHKQMTDDLH